MQSKPKILQILSMYHEKGEEILRENAAVVRTDNYDIAHLCDLVKQVEAIVLRAPAKITRDIIDANPNLKVISGAGVGLDNIDVSYARQKGIPVLHAPSVNKVSTAEHAVMFIMALSKSLITSHSEMRLGNYDSRTTIRSWELKNKKVGLIGFGNIGIEVAKRLKFGLEMQVSAWDDYLSSTNRAIADQMGITIVPSREQIFAQSDFVSLHIPLNDATRHSIDKNLLSLMKPSAFFVNTARGGVVKQDDLFAILQANKIAGAALDVFDPEPPALDTPLLKLPNVIVTPHIAGTTMECNYLSATTVATNVIRVLNGADLVEIMAELKKAN